MNTTPQLRSTIVLYMQYTSYDVTQKTYKTVSIENVNMKSKWTNVVLGSTEYFQVFIQKLCSHTISYNIYHQKLARVQDSKSKNFPQYFGHPLTKLKYNSIYSSLLFMHFLGPTLQFLGLCFHISRRGPSVRNCSRNSSSLYPCGDRKLLAKSHSRRQRVCGNELYHGGNTISDSVMDKKVRSPQCGNVRIFLPFRFYVKSILRNQEVQNQPFEHIQRL